MNNENRHVRVASYNVRREKLEKALAEMGYKVPVLVRLGGEKAYPDYPVQINSVKAVKNCIDKFAMKNILLNAGVPTAKMYTEVERVGFPCVVKGNVRSGGSSVFLAEDVVEFKVFKKLLRDEFYIEPLFPQTSEYRLHCTKDEVFFAVKKIKFDEKDIIINAKNHKNVQMVKGGNVVFPRLWKTMKEECLKAMKALDLEIGAIDVGYCSNGDHSFIIHEVNTCPELLQNTFNAYVAQLDKLIKAKIK